MFSEALETVFAGGLGEKNEFLVREKAKLFSFLHKNYLR
jgi:hypothetical protein